MTTSLDLPEDLVDEIRHRAAREGREFDEAVTSLLRQALAGMATTPADAAMLEARSQIAGKFLSGEWGTELAGCEAAREADREHANARDRAWRD